MAIPKKLTLSPQYQQIFWSIQISHVPNSLKNVYIFYRLFGSGSRWGPHLDHPTSLLFWRIFPPSIFLFISPLLCDLLVGETWLLVLLDSPTWILLMVAAWCPVTCSPVPCKLIKKIQDLSDSGWVFGKIASWVTVCPPIGGMFCVRWHLFKITSLLSLKHLCFLLCVLAGRFLQRKKMPLTIWLFWGNVYSERAGWMLDFFPHLC